MSRGFSRALAVALLVLVVVCLWRFGIEPLWVKFNDDREAIASARAAIARYQRLTAQRETFERALQALNADPRLDRALLTADSVTLAAAQLQQRVKATVERHGGALVSSQVLDAESTGPFAKVRVNVRMTVSVAELQQVLHDLESQLPVLVLDEMLTLARNARRRRGQTAQVSALDVRLQLAGFLTARSDSAAAAARGAGG